MISIRFCTFDCNYSQAIIALFLNTFTDSEGSVEGERVADLARKLIEETDKKQRKIFVAKDHEEIVGCIIFSRIWFEKSSVKAFLLAPVAVLTAYQRQGIGKQLISFGHDELRKDLADLVLTYGDVRFYQHVGYQHISQEVIMSPIPLTMPEGWLGKPLKSRITPYIPGASFCVPALRNPAYW